MMSRALFQFAVVATTLLNAPMQGPEGTATVRGRIRDALTGRPLRKVTVSFYPEHRNGYAPGLDASLPRRTAVSDSNGVFELTSLAAGEYSVSGSVVTGGYLDVSYGRRGPGGTSRHLMVADGARLDITMDAWPAAAISGRVIDQQGRPLVGVQVKLGPRRGTLFGSGT